MNMKMLVSENQFKTIIILENANTYTNGLKKIYEESKEILSKSSSQTKMNFSFMLTWGAALAGIMGPLNEFMSGNYPELSDKDLSLILTAACVLLYTDYKPKYDKLFKKIDEKGLNDELDVCLQKGVKLKSAFMEFLKSLNITFHSLTNIMSYAFLIPLMPMFYELAVNGYDTSMVESIVKSLSGFGIVTVSGNTLKKLVDRILIRFKS